MRRSWEPASSSASQGTRRCWFMSTFATVHQMYLAWARWIQSTSSLPTSIRSTVTLSTHLRLGLKVDSVRLPHHNPVFNSLLPICATCPIYLFLIDCVRLIIFGVGHKTWRFSKCLQLLLSSQAQTPSSARYSLTPSVFVLPLFWETKISQPTSQEAKFLYVHVIPANVSWR